MKHSFTLEELITHSFEEIEEKGRKLGLLSRAVHRGPGPGVIRSIISYSLSLKKINSRFAGNFSVVIN